MVRNQGRRSSRVHSRTVAFILSINDIVHEIHSNIRLFADDTSLYIIVDFPDSAA